MEIKIPIKKRDKQFGLLTWPKKFDFEIMTLFNKTELINVSVNGAQGINKKVSYRYRRFSMGKRVFKNNLDAKNFIIKKRGTKISIDLN